MELLPDSFANVEVTPQNKTKIQSNQTSAKTYASTYCYTNIKQITMAYKKGIAITPFLNKAPSVTIFGPLGLFLIFFSFVMIFGH